jgi:NDP-sugar pyrophosphorylase family protein
VRGKSPTAKSAFTNILVLFLTSAAHSARGQLAAYRHRGFWQPVDTLRDKRALEALWAEGNVPWKVWALARAGQDRAPHIPFA